MEARHHVGLRVRTVRIRRGLTQAQLAERIGRTIEAVSALERSKNFPAFETLKRLTEALEVPFRDFFDFDETDRVASRKRTALLTTITDALRSLDDRELAIAAEQVGAWPSGTDKKASRSPDTKNSHRPGRSRPI